MDRGCAVDVRRMAGTSAEEKEIERNASTGDPDAERGVTLYRRRPGTAGVTLPQRPPHSRGDPARERPG